MIDKQYVVLDERMQAAVDEMKRLIAGRFPVVRFTVAHGDDPGGIYLFVTLDLDDLEEVTDHVIDREVEFQLDEGLPLLVIPERTPERVAAIFAREAEAKAALLIP